MIDNLIKEIETGSLRYDLGFASTPRSLMQRIVNNDLVAEVRRQLRYDPDAVEFVLKRAKSIYMSQFKSGYQHSDDLVLATYIYLLSRKVNRSVRNFVQEIAIGRSPEFRGANGIAKIVVEQMPTHTAQPISKIRRSYVFGSSIYQGQRYIKSQAWSASAFQEPTLSDYLETQRNELGCTSVV